MINKSSTFISGVLAFGIYFVLIITLLFYFNMREETKPIHYVKKNEDSIRISVSSPKTKPQNTTTKKQTKKVVKKKPEPKKKAIKKETVKKRPVKKKVIKEKVVKKVKPPKKMNETKPTKIKKVNKPKDLFANVSAKKTPQKKKVEKQKVTKPKVSASELFNNTQKVQKRSDRGIENVYLAKIEEKLNGWPAQSEYAGEKAKVWLKVKPSGKFEFKVISASGNEDFNIGLVSYLRQLQSIGFGPHKGKRPYELNVEFVATE